MLQLTVWLICFTKWLLQAFVAGIFSPRQLPITGKHQAAKACRAASFKQAHLKTPLYSIRYLYTHPCLETTLFDSVLNMLQSVKSALQLFGTNFLEVHQLDTVSVFTASNESIPVTSHEFTIHINSIVGNYWNVNPGYSVTVCFINGNTKKIPHFQRCSISKERSFPLWVQRELSTAAVLKGRTSFSHIFFTPSTLTAVYHTL